MSSRHSVLNIGAPSGLCTADCFARGGSDGGPVGRDRGRTRAAFQPGIRLTGQGQARLEDDIRLEKRCRERARIALSSALRLVNQAIDEGRAAIQGIHTASTAPSNLEQAFSNLLSEFATARGPRLRVFVQGKPWTLNPAIQDQLFLIGREAAINALRHSQATKIEVEVQYLRELLRVFVRDNGCGVNPEVIQKESDSHWGLRGMRERAENIGARFAICSWPGVGTEVRVTAPLDVARRTFHDRGSWEGRSEI